MQRRTKHLVAVITGLVVMAVASPALARHKHHGKHGFRVQHQRIVSRTVQTVSYGQQSGYDYSSVSFTNNMAPRSVGVHQRPGIRHHHSIPSWVVKVDTAIGKPIEVDREFASKFQALIADFKEHGYVPKAVGCYALGHTHGSNHAGGGACDFDQTSWGHTVKFMYSETAEALIRKHGLFSGKRFGDTGHVEAMRGLYNYASR